VLAGYLFEIKLDQNVDQNAFGTAIEECYSKTFSNIYANILLEEVTFAGGSEHVPPAKTTIIRNQMNNAVDPLIHLDVEASNNYYFSGLSFTGSARSEEKSNPQAISLCLMKKNSGGIWEINNEEKLPNIQHGQEDDSIVFHAAKADTINVTSLLASTIKIDEGDGGQRPVPKIVFDGTRLKLTI
jgi:hypothetical protein